MSMYSKKRKIRIVLHFVGDYNEYNTTSERRWLITDVYRMHTELFFFNFKLYCSGSVRKQTARTSCSQKSHTSILIQITCWCFLSSSISSVFTTGTPISRFVQLDGVQCFIFSAMQRYF